MSGLRWLDVPFRYTTGEDFQRKLTTWLSDVFYDILPSHGYEVREEQIYTAFRIAETLSRKESLLAEAGSGTGKTFAYLLPALCYARYTGKPIILSSASSLLQEQLAGATGDILELSRLLNLNIDARVVKDPRNYLCQRKADRENWHGEVDGEYELLEADPLPANQAEVDRLNEWKLSTRFGDRAEIPEVSDELWQTVAWDETLACDRCLRRGYCQVAKNRLHAWAAQDFVVCSHDQFFRHLWSKSERLEEGLPPLLPESSAVIFDEGHLLERPAIEQLGSALREQAMTNIYQTMWANRKQLRAKLLITLEVLDADARRFFAAVQNAVIPEQTDRWFVQRDDRLTELAERCLHTLQTASDQLSIETELMLGTYLETDLLVASQRVEQAEAALRQFIKPTDASVTWWEPGTETLWILPSSFGTMIGRELTKEPQPLIFTSATLQAAGSFSGMKQLLGLPWAGESRVATSFQLSEQMATYLPAVASTDFTERAEQCLRLLLQNQGKALVLLRNNQELVQWRQYLQNKDLPFPLLWEGDGERAWLLQQFRQQVSSVLIGTSFWEGVDVPGEALSLVVVFSLPFPEPDPLTLSKRQSAERAELDPWLTVDLTDMLIKLRQGYGRLIRTAADYGVITVLDLGVNGEYRKIVTEALPEGVPVLADFATAWERVNVAKAELDF